MSLLAQSGHNLNGPEPKARITGNADPDIAVGRLQQDQLGRAVEITEWIAYRRTQMNLARRLKSI